ncbi:MAG: four helix bundle protein [Bacteroidetes bacterium]|nr:four helix bundle protein [Bacteroidota bacterium]MBU1483489.1 four helix bundle protein [Bacteroidota bacterium]MBU2046071.1 four helix bundle protein [Bacteroidota bacterium]MBU2269026.1 four helix bundle protein [Bacteroidota bacterium]MBU2376821.1 four helix bundle protein [Bacteroidota bacterium]
MTKEELIRRFRAFAIANAELISELPFNVINKNYSNQLIRCSSSSSANYRAACRAKSIPDFINKLKIVEEETDETLHFLDLIAHFNHPFRDRITLIEKEGNELLSITVASLNTMREKIKKKEVTKDDLRF